MISFLGTGLMGSEFVRAFRARGEDVQVWNRTAAKARALEADGARALDSPAQAVAGAARGHLSLAGDAPVDAVIAALLPSLARGLEIDPAEAVALFETFKVTHTVEVRGKRMAHDDFAATFELAMARKDVRLMQETADATGAQLEVLPAIARHMDALLAAGFG